jgi:hypothetical protein
MTPGAVSIVTKAVDVLATWPAFVVLLLLCVLFFGFLVPKAKQPVFAKAETTLPRKVLDEYFPGWTPAIADRFLAAIGPDGRAAYRRFYLTLDFWFPGTTASLATASLMLLAFPPTSAWAWLCVLAAPSWLLDIAENITHFRMARSYPHLSKAALTFGPLYTRAKWAFAILPLPLAGVGLLGQAFHAALRGNMSG